MGVRRVPVTPDNLDYDDGLYGHGVSMPEEHYEINLVDALRPEVINALDSFGERRLTQTLRVNAAAKIKLTRGVPPVQLPREMIDALASGQILKIHAPIAPTVQVRDTLGDELEVMTATLTHDDPGATFGEVTAFLDQFTLITEHTVYVKTSLQTKIVHLRALIQ